MGARNKEARRDSAVRETTNWLRMHCRVFSRKRDCKTTGKTTVKTTGETPVKSAVKTRLAEQQQRKHRERREKVLPVFCSFRGVYGVPVKKSSVCRASVRVYRACLPAANAWRFRSTNFGFTHCRMASSQISSAMFVSAVESAPSSTTLAHLGLPNSVAIWLASM